MCRTTSCIVSLAIAVIAGVGIPTATAAPTPTLLPCNGTVTTSIVLANNLVDCALGLTIGASGITVDLGGHLIAGTGADAGIDLAGHDDVTIRNGTLMGFADGLTASGSQNLTVRNVAAVGNNFGFTIIGSPKAAFEDVRGERNGSYGLRAQDSDELRVSGGGFIANDAANILLDDGADASIARTTLASSINDEGIFVVGTDDVTITASTVRDNGTSGIRLVNSTGSRITGSKIVNNSGDGVLIQSSDAAVKQSDIGGNGGSGALADGASTDVTFRDNLVHRNSIDGLTATLLVDSAHFKDNTLIRNGYLDGSDDASGRGISADNTATGTGNIAKGNDANTQCSPSSLCTVKVDDSEATLVQCGQLISESIVVGNNLRACDQGLAVSGSGGITIDLNGHLLEGTGDALENGIDLAGRDDLIVRDGALRGFWVGLNASSSERSKVSGIRAVANVSAGFRMVLANSNRFVSSRVEGNGGGFTLDNSDGNEISGSSVVGTTGNAIQAVNGSTGTTLSGNTVSASGGSGIVMNQSGGTRIGGGVARDNASHGIQLTGSPSEVKRVIAARNLGSGLRATTSADTVIKRSRFLGNGARGIEIFDESAVIARNKANGNTFVGIRVVAPATANIERNSANRNGFANGVAAGDGLGIDATLGSTGGANTAKKNDDPAQCAPAFLC